MKHAGYTHVMDIGVLSSEFRRQVDARHGSAHDFVIFRVLRARFGSDFHIPAFARSGDFQVEALAADELAVRDFLAFVPSDTHYAIADGQPLPRNL